MKAKPVVNIFDSLLLYFSQIIEIIPIELKSSKYLIPVFLKIISIVSFQNSIKLEEVVAELSKQWESEREYLKLNPNQFN